MIKQLLILFFSGLIFISCSNDKELILNLDDFSSVENRARNSEVTFVMWGGSPLINSWVDDVLGLSLSETYGIKLKAVLINDAAEYVNKLSTEKLAGLKRGSTDLIWINGENFKNAREADLLYGPYSQKLPNMKSFTDENAARYDFGFPVDGYESPYGKAQFVFEYDSEKIPSPPVSFADLKNWIKDHPGDFTYPQPGDFTGSAFIRQVFYEMAGGYEQFLREGMTREEELNLFSQHESKLWDYLNEIEPYLWQEGKTYPKSISVLEDLFARGELSYAMYYSPSHASGKIQEGLYKSSVKTFVMDKNSLTNTHFVAIPFNAPNTAGALVAANHILSPEIQLSKAEPQNWGDLPVIDYNKISRDMKDQFDMLDLGSATLSVAELSRNAVPEIPAGYVELLENGWEENVLFR